VNIAKITPMQAWCLIEADQAIQAIQWAQFTSKLEIQRMNKHSQTYVDLRPDPIDTEEPSDLMFWLYVACTVVVGAALLVILMGWS